MNRNQLAEHFLKGAAEIVACTGNKRVREVLDLLNCYALHAPLPVGTECVDTRPRNTIPKPIYRLIPLLPEDAEISEAWAATVNGLGAALVIVDMQAIIKCHGALSSFVCGLLLLHEGEHVRMLMEEPRNLKNQDVLVRDEIAVHKFQHELQSSIGGEVYKTLLERLIGEFTRNQYFKDNTFSIPPYDRPIRELDQAFGPSLSEYEYNLRTTMLWVHASMEYLSRNVPKEMEFAVHCAFFQSYYSFLIDHNTHPS